MKRYAQTLVAAALIGAAIYGQSYSALAAESALEKELVKTQIMPAAYKYQIVEEGSQITVQTHENLNSRDAEKDCKINAILLAKFIFEKRPKAARVRVLFYNRDNSAYRQLLVTTGDITAYGAGAVSQEKLLESLVITNGSTKAPAKKAAEPISSSIPVHDAATGRYILHSNGLSIKYPDTWTFTIQNHDGFFGDIGVPNNSNWTTIQLRRQKAPTAQQQCVWDEEFLLKNSYVRLKRESTTIGAGIPAIGVYYENTDTTAKIERIEHHIYFGDPDRIFTIVLACPKSDLSKTEPLFQKVLKTVALDF